MRDKTARPYGPRFGLCLSLGLLGLAGTADMRAILAASVTGDPDATLAVDVYAHRLRGSIAAMAGGESPSRAGWTRRSTTMTRGLPARPVRSGSDSFA